MSVEDKLSHGYNPTHVRGSLSYPSHVSSPWCHPLAAVPVRWSHTGACLQFLEGHCRQHNVQADSVCDQIWTKWHRQRLICLYVLTAFSHLTERGLELNNKNTRYELKSLTEEERCPLCDFLSFLFTLWRRWSLRSWQKTPKSQLTHSWQQETYYMPEV